jgi:hypothetical protein
MKVIETIFEESLLPFVNANGNIEFGFADSELSAVEMLREDKVAYRAEFRAWLNDVWLAKHRDRLLKILAIHGNEKRFTDLCSAVKANNIVPFVGSGMSQASGFPIWRDFLHQLRKYTNITESQLDTFLDAGEYEEAVDRLAAEMGRPLFDERIEHELRVEDTSTLTGPVRILAELFPNLILTTNLDDVLEHVYEAAGCRLVNVLPGRDIERYRQLHANGKSTLLKLHGDCRRDDGRVLGVTEYETAYTVGSPSREALALVYRTRPLLWLGCSLSSDRTMRLVEHVAAADIKTPRHFAFLRLPPDDAFRIARERVLSQRHIFPIWYDGDHDDCIESLLVGILDNLGRFAAADLE